MKPTRLALIAILIAAAFAGGLGFERWRAMRAGQDAAAPPAAAPRYHCPMHPDYVSDQPGTCPICGMNLVAIEPSGPASQAGAAGGSAAPPEEPLPGTIRVSAEKQQLIGVTYGTVEQTTGSRTIRAVGALAIDDTRVTKVHPRVDGWVERVFADEAGRLITTGQPLVTIYSPDVIAAQQEFLLALRSHERGDGDEPTRSQNERLVAAARKRLEVFDLDAAQIEQVARTGSPITAVTLSSPASGYVMTRNAYPRQRVTTDTELYMIADLRHLWVQAEVFEHDASFIRPGLPARVTVSYTGRQFAARVLLVEPRVDPSTRTLKVRLDVPNPGLSLKPDMFVDIEFDIREPSRLTVPLTAVLDSGERKTAFVDRGNGFLEPRQVETGRITGDRIEVLRGLSAGERVVVSGNFLIDSESQLKAAATGGPPAPAPAAPPPATGHQHQAPPPSRPQGPEAPHD